MTTCWARPIRDAGDRCDTLSAARTDAAAAGDWARFTAIDGELRRLMRRHFAVRCGRVKPLALRGSTCGQRCWRATQGRRSHERGQL